MGTTSLLRNFMYRGGFYPFSENNFFAALIIFSLDVLIFIPIPNITNY